MTKHTILFLAANPVGTDRLALDREARAIQVELERSGHREQFELVTRWAAEPLDLLRELRKLKPTVVHFSGHGSRGELQSSTDPCLDIVGEPGAVDGSARDRQHGLFFQSPDGPPRLVSAKGLAEVFGAAGSSVKLVTLSACYSDPQAAALAAHVDCVVGMRGSLRDDAARSFAIGFYGALSDGESVATSYRQACAAIGLEGLPDGDKPRLSVGDSVDAEQIVLADLAGGDLAARPAALVSPPPPVLANARLEAMSTQRAVTVTANDSVAKWRQFGLAQQGRVTVVGFRDAAIPIELDHIFVPLQVHADPGRRAAGPDRHPDGDKETLGHRGVEVSLEEALARARSGRTCLALIGDAGAGKTMLLRYLFRRVALGDVASPIAHLYGLHPVFVRLATIADAELVPRGLRAVIARVASEDGYPDAGRALLARPDQGFLFLLDGLDEVRDEPTRERLCAWLNKEVDHWPTCGFVVTSRRAAWTRTPALGALFLPVSVLGMRGPEREIYVRRWFHAVVRHFYGAVDPAAAVEARATTQAAALLEVLSRGAWSSHPRLLEMVANPLMLSTLCLAHYSDTRLPEQRGALYERTLGLLTEVWTRERAGGPALRLETARLILQPLAYAMHEHDRRSLSVEESAALVTLPLSQVPTVRAIAPTAERFLDLVRDECGLLMSRDLGRIEFIHLSFQEYLAACHVSNLGLGRTLAERAGDPRWEEVILLAMSRPGVFEPFIIRCLERGDVDVDLLRQCLREAPQVLPRPFEAAADRALAQLGVPDGVLAKVGRLLRRRPAPGAAADKLRRLFELVRGYNLPGIVERARAVLDTGVGDAALQAAACVLVGLPDPTARGQREPQQFVEPVTGMAFVWIPAGRFVMGSSKQSTQPNYDSDASHGEIPAHPVQLTGFWMSVYPVTNEQYTHFVHETGHKAPPSFTDRRFNDLAQPVVTVSWEAAQAFTVWLTSKLGGNVARLPTEAEWEYAARGTDGRRYPWGDEIPDVSRATFGQLFDAGRPAVVGHTPRGKSPFGVHDLAGNVWEWCMDSYGDYVEFQSEDVDPCYDDHSGYDRVFVVRGGAWDSTVDDLRSAFRGRLEPAFWESSAVGIRVVCRSSANRMPLDD